MAALPTSSNTKAIYRDITSFEQTRGHKNDAEKIKAIPDFIEGACADPDGSELKPICDVLDVAASALAPMHFNVTSLTAASKQKLLRITSTVADLLDIIPAVPEGQKVRSLRQQVFDVVREKVKALVLISSSLAMNIPGPCSTIKPFMQECIIFYNDTTLTRSKYAAMESAGEGLSGDKRKTARSRARKRWLSDLPGKAEHGGDGSGYIAWFTQGYVTKE